MTMSSCRRAASKASAEASSSVRRWLAQARSRAMRTSLASWSLTTPVTPSGVALGPETVALRLQALDIAVVAGRAASALQRSPSSSDRYHWRPEVSSRASCSASPGPGKQVPQPLAQRLQMGRARSVRPAGVAPHDRSARKVATTRISDEASPALPCARRQRAARLLELARKRHRQPRFAGPSHCPPTSPQPRSPDHFSIRSRRAADDGGAEHERCPDPAHPCVRSGRECRI